MSKPLVVLAVLVAASGCSFAARSPEMYRDDTKAVLESKNAEIRACYDTVLKSDAKAQGKVTVLFDVEPETGKISNVRVDKAQSTAPDAVSTCVRQIEGLSLNPPDARLGQGTWVYDFAPGAAPAPAPAPVSPGKS